MVASLAKAQNSTVGREIGKEEKRNKGLEDRRPWGEKLRKKNSCLLGLRVQPRSGLGQLTLEILRRPLIGSIHPQVHCLSTLRMAQGSIPTAWKGLFKHPIGSSVNSQYTLRENVLLG